MVLLYAAGRSVEQVAAEMGINPTTVSRRLRAAGVQMHPVGARRIPVSDEEILRLRGQGLLWRQVAEQVGMSAPGVHARWRRLGLAGHIDPMPTRPDETVALYESGMTVREVAKRMHLSTPTVTAKLKAAGVPTRNRGRRHPADDMEILRLRSTGLTWREVAAEVGMTQPGVVSRWTLLRRAGYEDPMPPR